MLPFGAMNHRSTIVALFHAALAASLLYPASARASSDAGPHDEDEVARLERALHDEHAALSTSDCTAACRALASIRRAAERICALDPGDRCMTARTRADDATRRVRDACPDCAIAAAPAPSPPAERTSTAASPPSESRRGGCAGCAAASSHHSEPGLVALVVAAALLGRRRKRRSRG